MTERITASPSRRDFIRDATAAAVGTAAVARFHGLVGAHAAGSTRSASAWSAAADGARARPAT